MVLVTGVGNALQEDQRPIGASPLRDRAYYYLGREAAFWEPQVRIPNTVELWGTPAQRV